VKSPFAQDIAEIIVSGFSEYRVEFKAITAGAKKRFENAEWIAAKQASIDRIELYDGFAASVVKQIRELLADRELDEDQWPQVKQAYTTLIARRKDYDLAETVFNTIYRKLFDRPGAGNDRIFVTSPFIKPPITSDEPVFNSYRMDSSLWELFDALFADYQFAIPYEDLSQDISHLVEIMESHIIPLHGSENLSLEILKPVFYRNKGAYLIGRMIVGSKALPIAIPILNYELVGLFVDTLIYDEDDLSIIFSFTRSYFMLECEYPSEVVQFMHSLLPAKQISEVYNSIGFYKHGKTEFNRGFLTHMDETDDQLQIAPGVKGLVMTVFTLPSYEVVFKVIKDRFSPTKKITREQVKASYYFVKTQDRLGRMADTQEFTNFVFPRHRFSAELLDELLAVAASSVVLQKDRVIIKHLYTERLMIPLNLYLEQQDDEGKMQALDEYGNAIKQLAAANIFPGDMLLKNFGVTRHRRVVFYDYDEICFLTDVNFREIPQARFPEQELAAEPWYSVGPRDVFPEEFRTFLFNSEYLKDLFSELHGEIFDCHYWQGLQESIKGNWMMDVFPYRRKQRFEHNP
jgi:isocitrate dehydrogenase kinase/phosphatase|tara:strand:- start:4621 stop:6342 length:1722 start_codon:yes stop_codon:yes gene_type:complete